MPIRALALLLATSSLLLGACAKKSEQTPPANSATDSAPAASTTATVAATPAAATTAAGSADVSPAATDESPEVLAKRKAYARAMLEDSYKNDPRGQWASTAKASSSYAGMDADATAGYHFTQVLGAPNVEGYGDDQRAWATKDQDLGIEWLEVSFARAVNASELRIRQTYYPGAIVQVELYDEAGKAYTVWQGPDLTTYEASSIAWLNIPFEKPAYKTQRAKITLATNTVPGWNEIDAVQLLGD
jgi:hypothetical protein